MSRANVQDVDAITLGNGVLEFGGLDLGLLSGDVELTPTADYYDFKAGVPKRIIKRFLLEEGATIKATYAELSAANFAQLVPNATEEIVAGTASGTATVSAEAHTLTGFKNTKLERISVDNTVATAITVAPSPSGSAYVVNTDYLVSIDDDTGATLIVRKSGGAIPDGGAVLVTYTYKTGATNASHRYHFGGKTALTERVMKFTHTRPDGRKVIVYFHKAMVETGMPLKFNEETVSLQDVTITAIADTTQTEGKELYYVDFED